MSLRRTALAITSLTVILGFSIVLWPKARESAPEASRSDALSLAPALAHAPPAAAGSDGTTPDAALDRFNEAAFIADMQARFGPHIHRPHAQVRSIEQLINYLRNRYPDDWESRVMALLQQLFPDWAELLYERFQSLIGYNEYLEINRAELRRMPAQERRDALWQARYQAFGPEADAIWAAERRSQALGDALRELDPELSTPARLEQFTAALHEIYGEAAPTLLDKRRTELVNRFLDQAPVRAELASMDPDERRDTLREVRAGLGMPEEALARWDALDAHRDAAWAAGQDYMQRREEILASGSPEDTQWQLDALRQEVFGEQAPQIRDEEASGFYRYAHERRYGRE